VALLEEGLRAEAPEGQVKALQRANEQWEEKCKAQAARIKKVSEENV